MGELTSHYASEERREAMRRRLLRDPMPVRMGNTASSLARLASTTDDGHGEQCATNALHECVLFLAWLAPEAEPDLQPELRHMHSELSEWWRRWQEGPRTTSMRTELGAHARRLSDRLLHLSGLLDASA